MQYMVIEKFHPGKLKAVYQRFEEKGRMLEEELIYICSWISEDLSVCFQLMEVISPDKLQAWVERWNDLADFELIPVITSAAAKEKVFAAG